MEAAYVEVFALPLNPTVGLAVASVTLVAWVVLVLVSSPNRKRRTVSDEMVGVVTPTPTGTSRTAGKT